MESKCFQNITLISSFVSFSWSNAETGIQTLSPIGNRISTQSRNHSFFTASWNLIIYILRNSLQVISAYEASSVLASQCNITWSLNMRSIVSSNNLSPRSSAYFVASWEIKDQLSIDVNRSNLMASIERLFLFIFRYVDVVDFWKILPYSIDINRL